MNMAYQEGMVDLRRAGLMKVMQGLTSLDKEVSKIPNALQLIHLQAVY